MLNLEKYKIILWDFDGVILDSMPIRTKGFEVVLQTYPKEQVDELIKFHLNNGGLSRYVKFRHFFENIRKETITDEIVNQLASSFSSIMLSLLINPELLINDSLLFITQQAVLKKMHIVSGSDQQELRKICEELDIARYFLSITGSPTPKKELVSNLINEYGYYKNELILIGDSLNDFDAATVNQIDFAGFNNVTLKDLGAFYIEKFIS